ncbi:MAG: sigma-54 dependent transcriptional regulator [Verrucomicrobium sp.]|nr:sigma-54 dependent transcriptional regulator [Verrucomicrobium sp.]
MTGVTGNLPGLLIVEDEKNTRDGLRRALEDKFEVYLASDIQTAWNVLESEPVDLLLTDLRLGTDSGMDLLSKAQSLPKPPICILMTAYGSVDTAVQAMRRGAYDYVTKPLHLDKLELLLTRALRSNKVEAENVQLRQELDQKYGLEKILGNSPALREVLEKIKQVANSRASVLIEGESGTGKELAAQALHRLSSRKGHPLITVHCAALSPQLLESELFGHEKGAFTGAVERRIGRFEEANHGTLFLDEIGEIDGATQVKLLRAIGERTVQRVGSNKPIEVDVRLITATNRDLEQEVAAGKFREDLFFRLNVVRLRMPSLRQRKEDIPILCNAFIKEFSSENGKRIAGLSPEAREAVQRYDWPGNVRELRMAMEHGVVLARGDLITPADLPERLFQGTPLRRGEEAPSADGLNLEAMEKRYIAQALRQHRGNRTEAAEALGISRRTLHRKLKEYGLEGM